MITHAEAHRAIKRANRGQVADVKLLRELASTWSPSTTADANTLRTIQRWVAENPAPPQGRRDG